VHLVGFIIRNLSQLSHRKLYVVLINITDVKIRSEVCSFVSKHRRMRQVNMKVVQLVHCSFSKTTVSTDLSNSYQLALAYLAKQPKVPYIAKDCLMDTLQICNDAV